MVKLLQIWLPSQSFQAGKQVCTNAPDTTFTEKKSTADEATSWNKFLQASKRSGIDVFVGFVTHTRVPLREFNG
jgi:hypothetical protein